MTEAYQAPSGAEHPITPPPELVEQWHVKAMKGFRTNGVYEQDIATQAARWGADQELEACVDWVQGYAECGDSLRTVRRPKPPSLKEQALAVIENSSICDHLSPEHAGILRRALGQLDD